MKSDLERVKSILLGAEYAELLELKNEFENSEAFTQAIANVIAEALEERAEKDNRVADVLAPTIDQAIAGSIDQDPKKLAESLYPIMGPAIRKSISETLQQMLENFNQLLEQSLSPKSLRWRFDAWRTGRSYSELVLLNTLEYQVEQVFLIHKETSLLIQHAYSELADMKDPDMVSSMFSAIQDFIEDSFSIGEHDRLDTLRLGDMSVVLQEGPNAILAAVVRGNIPEHLRSSMQQLIENIHRVKKSELQDFSGDPMDFADISEELHSILEFQQKQEEEERKIPWLALVAITISLAISGYYYNEDQKVVARMTAAVDGIDAQPGIVVLGSERNGDSLTIEALADPLAEPERWLQENVEIIVELNTQPYLSADDDIVALRASQLLSPENTTTFEVLDGQLIISGHATQQWLRTLGDRWQLVPGVNSMDMSGLTLSNPVLQSLNEHYETVSSFSYVFEKEASEIETSDLQLAGIVSSLNEIDRLREIENLPTAKFDVVGYTDDSGSPRLNRRIGQERAQALRALLIEKGISGDRLNATYGEDYARMPILKAREVRVYITE